MNRPNPCEYLSHSFFYNFGSQVISPALHAELVPALESCKILEEKAFQSGTLENINGTDNVKLHPEDTWYCFIVGVDCSER